MQALSSVSSNPLVLLSAKDFRSRRVAQSPSHNEDFCLAAMSRLAEAEARQNSHAEIVLVVQGQGDLQWLPGLVARLWELRRAVVLRLHRCLPPAVARELAQQRGEADRLMVELSIAHHDPEISALLLGPDSADAQTLLLHAQFLARLGFPLRVRLGALLPGIHDRPGVLEALLQEIQAADIRWILPYFSALDGEQMGQILELVEPHRRAALRRSFGWEKQKDGAEQSRGKRCVSGKLQRRDQWLLRAFVERGVKACALSLWGAEMQQTWLRPRGGRAQPQTVTPQLFDRVASRHLH